MNEFVHNHYYEERLGDRNFTKNVFIKASQDQDPSDRAKFFFNDFQCVTVGVNTAVSVPFN